MKKTFIDTNVTLDLLAKRAIYQECKSVFALVDKNKIELYISTLRVSNTHYIRNVIMKFKNAKEIIGKIKDFEDGIQY